MPKPLGREELEVLADVAAHKMWDGVSYSDSRSIILATLTDIARDALERACLAGCDFSDAIAALDAPAKEPADSATE